MVSFPIPASTRFFAISTPSYDRILGYPSEPNQEDPQRHNISLRVDPVCRQLPIPRRKFDLSFELFH